MPGSGATGVRVPRHQDLYPLPGHHGHQGVLRLTVALRGLQPEGGNLLRERIQQGYRRAGRSLRLRTGSGSAAQQHDAAGKDEHMA